MSLGSPINHQIFCSPTSAQGIQLQADVEELPLESDSVDAIVAHHCLDFCQHPHQALREMHRVLTPQGQLVVAAFNPFSVQGANTYVRGLFGSELWRNHRPVSERRLTDWLHLLGCEVQEVKRVYALPPAGRGRLRRVMERADSFGARHNLPMGGLYLLHARKQVVGCNRPQRSAKAARASLIGLVPKPAASPTPITPASNNIIPFREKDRN